MPEVTIRMRMDELVLNHFVQLARREGRSAGAQAVILITQGVLADLKAQVEADEAAADAAAAAARLAAEVR